MGNNFEKINALNPNGKFPAYTKLETYTANIEKFLEADNKKLNQTQATEMARKLQELVEIIAQNIKNEKASEKSTYHSILNSLCADSHYKPILASLGIHPTRDGLSTSAKQAKVDSAFTKLLAIAHAADHQAKVIGFEYGPRESQTEKLQTTRSYGKSSYEPGGSQKGTAFNQRSHQNTGAPRANPSIRNASLPDAWNQVKSQSSATYDDQITGKFPPGYSNTSQSVKDSRDALENDHTSTINAPKPKTFLRSLWTRIKGRSSSASGGAPNLFRRALTALTRRRRKAEELLQRDISGVNYSINQTVITRGDSKYAINVTTESSSQLMDDSRADDDSTDNILKKKN